MNSVLEKHPFQLAVEGKLTAMEKQDLRIAAGVVVALIEIRVALEENTAVQRQILDKGVDAEQGFQQLLAALDPLTQDLESVRATMKLHGGLMEQIGKIQTEHAVALAKLAEEKQDRPDVLNGPDTAREGG